MAICIMPDANSFLLLLVKRRQDLKKEMPREKKSRKVNNDKLGQETIFVYITVLPKSCPAVCAEIKADLRDGLSLSWSLEHIVQVKSC